MEYVQERITTLHDLHDAAPDAPTGRTAVVVPMTAREHGRPDVQRTFDALERVDPAHVVVALRAPARVVDDVSRALATTDLAHTVLWCNGPELQSVLAEGGLDGPAGKGADVWLALGVAAEFAAFVAVHDADVREHTGRNVSRLCWPLANGFDFSKGYYARVEGGQLYGRLFRLFVAPLLETLCRDHDAPILDYLASFRYALAGEFAATAPLARSIGVHRTWGLELDTLGDAFDHAGFDGSAQVDLGVHRHDHRPVAGPGGLTEMATAVGEALFSVVESNGVTPNYETLPPRYRECAREFVRRYAADAAFNGLAFDPVDERSQVDRYATAIEPTDRRDRLPPFRDAPIDAESVLDAAGADRGRVRSAGRPQG